MSSTRAELMRQLLDVNGGILTVNSQIRELEGQLGEIEDAQTELSEIISTADENKVVLDLLDCEDLHFWRGSNQTLRATDYNECQRMMTIFTGRLDTWEVELAAAHSRISLELAGQRFTLGQLTVSRDRINDSLRDSRRNSSN